mmetsp:Transcript_5038/g.9877  ORF Transcript_5038/g.9877 Transcript_5038/m.9877 type:complete len:229 (-) Transcript_5038:163-849(-)
MLGHVGEEHHLLHHIPQLRPLGRVEARQDIHARQVHNPQRQPHVVVLQDRQFVVCFRHGVTPLDEKAVVDPWVPQIVGRAADEAYKQLLGGQLRREIARKQEVCSMHHIGGVHRVVVHARVVRRLQRVQVPREGRLVELELLDEAVGPDDALSDGSEWPPPRQLVELEQIVVPLDQLPPLQNLFQLAARRRRPLEAPDLAVVAQLLAVDLEAQPGNVRLENSGRCGML